MAAKVRKAERDNLLACLGAVLEQDGLEVIAVRDKGCKILFANSRAQTRIDAEEDSSYTCKSVYAKDFPELCERCPYGGRLRGDEKKSKKVYEVKDKGNRRYTVTYNEITWLDGKPITIIFLNDITKETETREHLFSLAYVDQLTSIPNRQKLKEDFSALEEQIEKNLISGAFALFDIDNFKNVNDTYGHNTGDVILRRLTEHLQSDNAFKGHLYRLGGDEFVLFYSNETTAFKTEEEFKKHYIELISGALQTYTLPNISLKCTLSIGLSFFPKHGTRFSDVLRKSDIAMYKSKTGGRNQLSVFEDQYDIAKKFKDLYINIQPVLLSSGKTFGYELIDGESSEKGKEEDGTVTLSEFNRAMDALGFGEINNKSHYFITFTRQLLNPAVLGNMPRDKFIVMLPIISQVTKEELQIYVELKRKGYMLAVKGLKDVKAVEALFGIVNYCIFGLNEVSPIIRNSLIKSNPTVRFIASGIDTPHDFAEAKNAGFNLFQGFFFNQQQPPVVKKTKDMEPLKLNYLRLLKASSTDDYMDFREISSIISSDVALTYKLLRILNSAAVGLRNVSNMAMAVAYMGEESLKKWIAVLALRGITEDKPLELVRMSLIRARFGELLAPHFRIRRNPEQVFLVGMLSLLHIALEKTKEEMLEEIPVSDEIRESLLTKTGIHSDLLHFFENFEYANWDEVSRFTTEEQLSSQFVNDSYIAAVKWYNNLSQTSEPQ